MKSIRTLGLLALLMVVPSVFAAPEVPGKGIARTLQGAAGLVLGATARYAWKQTHDAIMPDLENFFIERLGEGAWRSRFATLVVLTAKIAHFVGYEVAREYVAGLIDGADEEQIATKTSRVSTVLAWLYLDSAKVAEMFINRTEPLKAAAKLAAPARFEKDLAKAIELSNAATTTANSAATTTTANA